MITLMKTLYYKSIITRKTYVFNSNKVCNTTIIRFIRKNYIIKTDQSNTIQIYIYIYIKNQKIIEVQMNVLFNNKKSIL